MEIDNETSETTKARSGVGCLKCIVWVAVILALLGVIAMFGNRARVASRLQKMLAELDSSEPGWRLEQIEAAREDLPESENSARAVLAAAGKLPLSWPSKPLDDERIRSMPANEQLSEEYLDRLSSELATVQASLDMAAKLADMPRGRHRIHYERNPLAIPLPHLMEIRKFIALLKYESMYWNQKGNSTKALTVCRAALNAARSIGDEPFYISQLDRSACILRVCEAIERTLAQGEPPPEDMNALQKLLENEDTFPALLIAMRGERAVLHGVFSAVERGEVSLKELEGFTSPAAHSEPRDWLKNTAVSLWRMDTQADNELFLSLMTRHIKVVQLPPHEQAALEKKFEQDIRALPKRAMITRLLLIAASKMGESFRRKHAMLRSTITALAAERYRCDKKAWPDNVDKLCPRYLASVPLDPYDGKALRYRRLKDGVVVYSIGQDGIDNDGQLDPKRATLTGMDIGFRLWDVAQRRQPPKPKPPQPPTTPIPLP